MAQIAFADSETRSLLDVKTAGAYKYARHWSTEILVWCVVFDDEPDGLIWSPPWAWGNQPNTTPDKAPERLLDHIAEGGYLVAWNAFFDHNIWREVMVKKYRWPPIALEQVWCAQAQAQANNLPAALAKAAQCLGTPVQKDTAGKRLIQLLSNGSRDNWDSARNETVDKMGHFRAYCLKDVLSMRAVWNSTRPLTLTEWREYHASERINFRGIAVDEEFAEAAMNYANAEFADINRRLAKATGDQKITVTNHPRKARWMYENLWPAPELQELVQRPPKKVEGKPDRERYSADRPTRELLLELLAQPDYADLFEPAQLDKVLTVLELIEEGNSAAVRKFTAIYHQAIDGRVYGSYNFNGAGQTGRFSSRGIQIHNIIRQPVDKNDPNRAIDAMECVIAGNSAHQLKRKFNYPVSRLLARLIRPTFIAEAGNMLVWGDWSQIEARILPWLSQSPGGEAKLDLFRQGKDVYSYAALPIYGETDIANITPEMRQVGKVSELALGYSGGAGAFAAMGRNYGVILETPTVQRIVNTWRANNQWCVTFWSQLWDASVSAYNHPGEWYHAGRVRYLFHVELMGGTLICALPDNRLIVYPQYRREQAEYTDKQGNTRIGIRTSFVKGFGSGYGRIDLWRGVLCENISQAVAGSFLRRALVELDDIACGHTHDEVITECAIDQVEAVKADLYDIMTELPAWASGLPLEATIEVGPFYTK